MKIEFLKWENPEPFPFDDQAFAVWVDDELIIGFSDGCPEDGTIARNFSDVLKIPKLVKLISKAFNEGKKIEIIEKTCDTFEAVFKDD